MEIYKFLSKLKTSDTRYFKIFHRLLWRIFHLRVYYGKTIGRLLLNLRYIIRIAFDWLKKVFIVDPLFRAYCKDTGKNITFYGSLPWIEGDGAIVIGDNVQLHGNINIFFGCRNHIKPHFFVGNNTHIGFGCSFSISDKITIGDNVLIASGCHFMDNNGHPLDYKKRRDGEKVAPEDIKPTIIQNDVWIGLNTIILSGVTIGEKSIIRAGSIVSKNIPPLVIAGGNPAITIRDLKS